MSWAGGGQSVHGSQGRRWPRLTPCYVFFCSLQTGSTQQRVNSRQGCTIAYLHVGGRCEMRVHSRRSSVVLVAWLVFIRTLLLISSRCNSGGRPAGDLVLRYRRTQSHLSMSLGHHEGFCCPRHALDGVACLQVHQSPHVVFSKVCRVGALPSPRRLRWFAAGKPSFSTIPAVTAAGSLARSSRLCAHAVCHIPSSLRVTYLSHRPAVCVILCAYSVHPPYA